MAFDQTDKNRIMLALGYPFQSYFYGAVSDGCTYVTRFGGTDAEDRIKAYLDSIDTINDSLSSAPDQNTLIKADVLEWQAGGKVKGLLQERGRLTMLVANALNLMPYNSGSNTLVRS